MDSRAAALGAHGDLREARSRYEAAAAARTEAVRRLHESGWSYAQIAELLGVTRSAAAKMCR